MSLGLLDGKKRGQRNSRQPRDWFTVGQVHLTLLPGKFLKALFSRTCYALLVRGMKAGRLGEEQTRIEMVLAGKGRLWEGGGRIIFRALEEAFGGRASKKGK